VIGLPPDLTGSSPRILAVDDDPMVLSALETTLSRGNHRVFATQDPFVALEFLKESRVSVIIADQRMDAMTGLELLDRARQLQPNASRILITGLLSVKTLIEAVNCGEIYRFIGKPWSTPELLATVVNAVQRFQLLEENSALLAKTCKLNEELMASNRLLEARVAELAAQRTALETSLDGFEASRVGLFDFCDAVLSAFDPVLGARTRLTVEICKQVAKSAGLRAGQRQILIAAAWFHDIGWIAYSQDFARKCARGVDSRSEEAVLLRSHPVHSERLTLAAGLGAEVGLAVRAHHECFDGGGFPDHREGQQIPEAARWLTPVAYFVASGLSRESAVNEIEHLSGIAFDPVVVSHFLEVAFQSPSPEMIAQQPAPAPDGELTALRRLYSKK
jgi:response regulator RpfG family c-di-GMP phosphodiesterase